MSFEPIENYGVIGNMQSIGLVGMNGSIDFLCYPNFDSPTVFAALLDDQKGGNFEIRPQLTNARVRQMYLPETNILITRFLAAEGVSELTDFMPIDDGGGEPNEIVRKERSFEATCVSKCLASRVSLTQRAVINSNYRNRVQRSARFRTTAHPCRCIRPFGWSGGHYRSPG
jgi:GH15 family glucan-1,4-alpha-glucosidase